MKTVNDTNVNPLKVATKQAKPTLKKEVPTVDDSNEAIEIFSKLDSITKDKEAIKTKHDNITQNVKDVIPMITAYVKKLREDDKVYKDAKKTTLVKLIKLRLGSKEHVVNTVCDVMILGLNIDNTLSLSSMAFVVKCVSNGSFSKAKVNKADKTTLETMITNQHKANRLAIAKKLIG